MRGNVKITATVFDAVKVLLKGGATVTQCAEYMKISHSAVSLIKKSETYEEYKQNCYMTSASYRKKMAAIHAKEAEKKETAPAAEPEKKEEPPVQVVEHRQTITVQATHYMLTEQQKTNELLTLISNKLAFIVDELTK